MLNFIKRNTISVVIITALVIISSVLQYTTINNANSRVILETSGLQKEITELDKENSELKKEVAELEDLLIELETVEDEEELDDSEEQEEEESEEVVKEEKKKEVVETAKEEPKPASNPDANVISHLKKHAGIILNAYDNTLKGNWNQFHNDMTIIHGYANHPSYTSSVPEWDKSVQSMHELINYNPYDVTAETNDVLQGIRYIAGELLDWHQVAFMGIIEEDANSVMTGYNAYASEIDVLRELYNRL